VARCGTGPELARLRGTRGRVPGSPGRRSRFSRRQETPCTMSDESARKKIVSDVSGLRGAPAGSWRAGASLAMAPGGACRPRVALANDAARWKVWDGIFRPRIIRTLIIPITTFRARTIPSHNVLAHKVRTRIVPSRIIRQRKFLVRSVRVRMMRVRKVRVDTVCVRKAREGRMGVGGSAGVSACVRGGEGGSGAGRGGWGEPPPPQHQKTETPGSAAGRHHSTKIPKPRTGSHPFADSKVLSVGCRPQPRPGAARASEARSERRH
jgi:hypothetical protein